MYDPALEKERIRLNAIVCDCIYFLLPFFDSDEETAREKLGKAIGYKSRRMIDRILSDRTVLPGPIQMRRLLRTCSEHGCDDGANDMSADDKMNVRVYVLANGRIDDDLGNVIEGSGMARAAYRNRDPLAMASYINTAYAGVQGLLAERELMLRGNGQRVCGDLFR